MALDISENKRAEGFFEVKKYARLEQKDIEFAIKNELARVGLNMVGNAGSWKLIKATEQGEKDAIAFECQIENVGVKDDEE